MDEEILNDENVRLAIQKAANSLARCEQCRAGLERKLVQKEIDRDAVKIALDYLEEKGYLSDERYASMWVRNHCAFKFHGKIRVMNELLSRGVPKQIAEKACDDYFAENNELDVCVKACKKYLKQGKSKEKLLNSLAQSGFSYNIIQKAIKKIDLGVDDAAE